MWNAVTVPEIELPILVLPPQMNDITYGGAVFHPFYWQDVDESRRPLVCLSWTKDPTHGPTLLELYDAMMARL